MGGVVRSITKAVKGVVKGVGKVISGVVSAVTSPFGASTDVPDYDIGHTSRRATARPSGILAVDGASTVDAGYFYGLLLSVHLRSFNLYAAVYLSVTGSVRQGCML